MKFENYKKELKEKVKKGSSTYSRGDHIGLTLAALNDVDYSYNSYSKKGDSFEVTNVEPTKKFRNSIKKFNKKVFGHSDAELSVIDNAEFSKDMAEAIVDLSAGVDKSYMETGKTLKLPMTNENEAAMKISLKQVKEDVRDTSKIVKDETTGEYKSVPTGKTVKTAEHTAIVAKNAVPGWLKKEV